jgi:transketolase
MTALDTDRTAQLARHAHAIRRQVVEMCRGRGRGYAGQGLALADLMAVLYHHELRRDDAGELRDALIVSTGHSAIAQFAVLGTLGVYAAEELATYGMDGSRIEESPLEGLPGFEITGGSLGQGLSQAVGIALAERLHGTGNRVFCLVSDGELQEGQTWEAAMAAGHHGLGDLVVFIDNNRTQADGLTASIMGVEPVPEKFAAFGFAAERVDAHDLDALIAALARARDETERPTAIVLETTLAKGVPCLETYRNTHYIRVEDAVWAQALAELEESAP